MKNSLFSRKYCYRNKHNFGGKTWWKAKYMVWEEGHIWVWCGCRRSWTSLEKVKVWINTRVINVTRIGGHESKSCHVTFLLILTCWETIGCKPCGDAEENSTQIFNYIYIFLRVYQGGTVGMGVPYNIIMVGFEWAANQKKVTRGKKYCLIWYAKQKKM